MKRHLLLLCCAMPLPALAACLPHEVLVDRDRQYEAALATGNVAFLRDALADDYVWVHTLGSEIETKPVLLARMARPTRFKSRTTGDVQARTLGDTTVLHGVSIVEQWNADGTTFKTNRYQFMRTWVDVAGQCRLLGVQTMNLSSK
ncbi:nuclear transport factor 2 family protein [Massilia sp. METH4]|uniref:nuclear transport factor 2 family protein n=1 Tax=Massilia sp. METH4 TaxID=3123041 RepID=UPI0030D16385